MDIQIKYIWDKPTYLKASYYNFRQRMPWLRVVIPILAILILVLDMFLIVLRGLQLFDVFPLLIVLLVSILRWPFFGWLLGRQFDKYAEKNDEIKWRITDEKLFVQAGQKSEASFEWPLIKKAVKTPEGFLLYRFPIFHWIPFYAFKSQADLEAFENALKKTPHAGLR